MVYKKLFSKKLVPGWNGVFMVVYFYLKEGLALLRTCIEHGRNPKAAVV